MSQIPMPAAIDERKYAGWRPPEFPDLSGEAELAFDTESRGLRWWKGEGLVGLAVATRDGHSWYFPTGHAGGNLPEDKVRAWAGSHAGLRGKKLVGYRTGFDVHQTHEWGLDLEELGCTVTDVSHTIALLDDRRREFGLEAAARDFLGEHKVAGIDTRHMVRYHAADVENYACQDALLAMRLRQALLPRLAEQGLMAVQELEDECIYVTCEMERNGSPMDEELLDKWLLQSERDLTAALFDLYRDLGFHVNPKSHDDAARAFAKLGVDPPTIEFPGPDFGSVTFADPYLKRYEHPTVKKLRRARKLSDLKSKSFVPYKRELGRNGLIRYALNQLMADSEDGGTAGTISGRYSSSAVIRTPRDGINIQQVAGKKQMGYYRELPEDDPMLAYVTRKLFIPEKGKRWCKADAEQIEYRLFAHYAKPPHVLEAYARDPRTDFHNIVLEMIRKVKPDMTRERTKDCNFAKIYGAGLKKIAYMIGLPINEAAKFVDAYDHAFPQASRLLNEAKRMAGRRGYVKTLMGRRARFDGPNDMMLHSALNRVIQGTAADINKRKLVELHRERKYTGLKLRFTVHDEADGDVHDAEGEARVREVLNRQSFDTRVPIFWAVKSGQNWAECN